MTVIFLDIDGVVTSARDNGFRDFNLHVVHWLRFLCQESGAKIVISSTWRHSHNEVFWKTIFGEYLHSDWRTPSGERRLENGLYVSRIRGDEIAKWLAANLDVTSYWILDDDSDFRDEQKPFHIKTDAYNGMLFESFMQLRDGLKIAIFPGHDAEIYQHPNMFGRTRQVK